ncbi:superoxide dismutase family protein [Sphingomonas bacterium]|uniref:superoxide dismutase family protein n=1 Tax=Sphingomonas bacterium TaxID=1895847 RepID=UPI0015765FDC|nr:superoxide dismutase family protein [Sphingomonas bacterium]
MRLLTALVPLALIAMPAQAQVSPHTFALKNASGGSAGTVTLTDAPKGLLVHVEATGLTPGWHGIHIHEKADCSDAAFKTAGAHVHSAVPVVHGLLNPAASDQGDLTNIYAGADGAAKADIATTMASLAGMAGTAKLLDADGSAIVIHAKPDDYTTQPIGGSGDRVACGVVR